MMDEKFMKMAIEAAGQAKKYNEVPIGAVIVYENDVIGRGFNLRETTQLTTSHAELMAIKEANERIGSWRLEDCTLYCTLEPCQMCAGAIVQSRIKRVVFGAYDPKAGCAGTIINLLNDERFNHTVEVEGGILEESCKKLLVDFFKKIRHQKKNKM